MVIERCSTINNIRADQFNSSVNLAYDLVYLDIKNNVYYNNLELTYHCVACKEVVNLKTSNLKIRIKDVIYLR